MTDKCFCGRRLVQLGIWVPKVCQLCRLPPFSCKCEAQKGAPRDPKLQLTLDGGAPEINRKGSARTTTSKDQASHVMTNARHDPAHRLRLGRAGEESVPVIIFGRGRRLCEFCGKRKTYWLAVFGPMMTRRICGLCAGALK